MDKLIMDTLTHEFRYWDGDTWQPPSNEGWKKEKELLLLEIKRLKMENKIYGAGCIFSLMMFFLLIIFG